MMENLQSLLLQTEKRQDKKLRQEAEEAEKRQDEKAEARQKTLLLETEERRRQEAEERKRETEDIKALIQEQKQMQEHSTAELGLLRGELNKQVTKTSEVQESMTLKIAEVEKSVSSVEELSLIHI